MVFLVEQYLVHSGSARGHGKYHVCGVDVDIEQISSVMRCHAADGSGKLCSVGDILTFDAVAAATATKSGLSIGVAL